MKKQRQRYSVDDLKERFLGRVVCKKYKIISYINGGHFGALFKAAELSQAQQTLHQQQLSQQLLNQSNTNLQDSSLSSHYTTNLIQSKNNNNENTQKNSSNLDIFSQYQTKEQKRKASLNIIDIKQTHQDANSPLLRKIKQLDQNTYNNLKNRKKSEDKIENSQKQFNDNNINNNKVSSNDSLDSDSSSERNEGEIYVRYVAVKIEDFRSGLVKKETCLMNQEIKVLRKVGGKVGFAKMLGYEFNKTEAILVTDLLKADLETLFQLQGSQVGRPSQIGNEREFSLETTLMICLQCIDRLEVLHEAGYIHRDIKPQNLMIGDTLFSQSIIHMIDFGISRSYLKKDGSHIEYTTNNKFVGTQKYSSLAADTGLTQGRKDDLEALGYVLVYFLKGCLPWDFIQMKDQNHFNNVKSAKQLVGLQELCQDLSHDFWKYFKYLKSLKYNETPNYSYLKSLFRNILLQDKLYINFSFDWEKDLSTSQGNLTSQTIYTSIFRQNKIKDQVKDDEDEEDDDEEIKNGKYNEGSELQFKGVEQHLENQHIVKKQTEILNYQQQNGSGSERENNVMYIKYNKENSPLKSQKKNCNGSITMSGFNPNNLNTIQHNNNYNEVCSYTYETTEDSSIPSEESNVASYLSVLDQFFTGANRPTIQSISDNKFSLQNITLQ